MKAWKIKDFQVIEIEIENKEDGANNRNVFWDKEEALIYAVNIVNERVSDNLTYLQRIYEQFKGQIDVVNYYIKKRENLIKGSNIINSSITLEELEKIKKEIAVDLSNCVNNTGLEIKEVRKMIKKFKRKHKGKVIIKDM